MVEKQSPCCARRIGKLTHDRNNLRVLAQRAALADQKGQSIVKLKKMMDEAKEAIAHSEQSIVDHDAEHAAESAA